MKNLDLATDYLTRAENRLAAIEVLVQRKGWADVVRESQEVVELCLKALLRKSKIEVPRLHDVSGVLEESTDKLPKSIQSHVKKLSQISRSMRRDRELSYYGSEDLTPSEFYHQEDAEEAFDDAKWVFSVCKQ